MSEFLAGAWHYIVVLAAIGAVCALAVTGTGNETVYTLIGTIAGVTFGAGVMSAAPQKSSST